MKRIGKRSLAMLLSVVMILTSIVFALPLVADAAVTTSSQSGLIAEFYSSSTGSTKVDSVAIASGGGFASTIYLRLKNNNSELPILVTRVQSSSTYGRINNSSTYYITPNQTLDASGEITYPLTATTSLTSTTVLTYTITYQVVGLLDENGNQVTASTQVAYITAEKLNPTKPFVEMRHSPTVGYKTLMDFELTATTGYLTMTASTTNAQTVAMTANYYVNTENATTYPNAGLMFKVTNQNDIQYDMNAAKATLGGQYNAIGSFGVLASSLTTSTTETSLSYSWSSGKTKGGVTDLPFYGTIPTGSTTSASPATVKLALDFQTNASLGRGRGYITLNMNVYSYSKAALRTAINTAEGRGYNSKYYSSAAWSTFTTALKNAKEQLGKTETTQYAITTATSALTSATSAMATSSNYAMRAVKVTHNYYPGVRESSTSATTTYTYYLVSVTEAFVVPYDESITDWNKRTAQVTKAAGTSGTTQTYNYWTIDYSPLKALYDYIDTLDENRYTAESWANLQSKLTTAYGNYMIDGNATPTYQSSITTATTNVQAAIDALEELQFADYSAFDALAESLGEDWEQYYTEESVKAVKDIIDGLDRYLPEEAQETVNDAVTALAAAIEALEPLGADYSAYEAIIGEAEEKAASGLYTTASTAALQQAIDAEIDWDKSILEQAYVAEQVARIQAAIDALVLRVTDAQITELTELLETLKPELDAYGDANYKNYTDEIAEIIEEAAAFLSLSEERKANIPAEDVADYMIAIKSLEAYGAGDYTLPDAAIAEIGFDELDAGLYTVGSWDALAEIVAQVKKYDRLESAQAAIDAYADEVRAAFEALELVKALSIQEDAEGIAIETVQVNGEDVLVLTGVDARTAIETVIASYLDFTQDGYSEIKVKLADGTYADGTAFIGTGMVVEYYYDGKLQSSMTAVVLGDLTGTGTVTTEDAAILKNIITGDITELTKFQIMAADVTGDGMIDLRDVRAIMEMFI